MTLGLLAGGPLQMLFSLLLMQGLSLTMWRTFLNQAIPRFDPLRFNVNLGNNRETSSTTTSAPVLDQQLLPYLSLLTPILAQRQMQQMSQMSQMSTMPQNMVYQQTIPAVQQQVPQVIVVPQIMPQNIKQGSASTNIPVQVEPPDITDFIPEIPDRMYKRMLERPPKTTRKPKMVTGMHAGTLHYTFVTPKIPAGFRRYIISPVTAKIEPETEKVLNDFNKTTDSGMGNGFSITGGGTISNLTNNAMNGISIDLEQQSLYPIVYNFSNNTSDSNSTTEVAEPVLDNNKILNTTENNFNETNDFIHEDFIEHVKNITNLSQIETNQSPEMDEIREEIYFENSKETKNHIYKRVCYYQLNAIDGHLKVSDIDPFICTHLIVGFASVANNDLMVPRNPSEDPEKYRHLTNLKAINRNLKVMLSVGDVSGGAFSKMVSNYKSRDNFVASALDICDMFNFDGIDIDWEFPSFRTGSKEDKTNFISLLKELKIEAIRRFRDDFIISAAVGTPLIIAMASYDIPLIAEAVDFVNLMSYDFHYYREDRPYTGHHSPLYPRPIQKGYYLTLNAAWAATFWANKGMPLRKIILGIPTYARSYSLVVPISQGLDVPVNGPGIGGGKLNYTSVCHFLSSGATKEFDIHSQVPFAYKDYDWIAYENEISVALKAEWIVKANMGGIMTFSLNYDDTKGHCRKDGKKFPLQKAISNLLELASIKTYQKLSHLPLSRVNNRIN